MEWLEKLNEALKYIEKNFESVPKLWQDVAQSGKLNEIVSLIDETSMGVLGVSAYMDRLEKWEYYIAVATGKEAPKGME